MSSGTPESTSAIPSELSPSIISAVLMEIRLASSHTTQILGRPTPGEIEEAATLIRERRTPEHGAKIYTLISTVLEQVDLLTPGLEYALKLRLHVAEVSTSTSNDESLSRDEELFNQLVAGKIISRERIYTALGIGNYTLTGHLATMRQKHFPEHIIVTADQGLLLLEESADFYQVTREVFSADEQRSPTRVSVFMYLLLKMGKANSHFSMRDVFAEMQKIGLPVGKKDALIAHAKKLLSYKGYLLESVNRGVYNLTSSKKH